MAEIAIRDWTPRANNAVYCSPACGGGCTRAEYDHATQSAKLLARRMGPGWEPVVWENLGWHYRVEKGVAAIHPAADRYIVFFNTARQVVITADTPEDALGFAVQEARGIERQIAADCADLLREDAGHRALDADREAGR